ncbi:MAG: Rossmann-like and DUF2520 domain-containing protein [Bacteroidia bacterium]
MIKGIAIIGSGNTAWQLAYHFVKSGISLNYIAGRNAAKVAEIASEFNIDAYDLDSDLPKAEGAFICVSDSYIGKVSSKVTQSFNWQVHCCGSVSIHALHGAVKGVFYPLQTMTKNRALNAKSIPICLESNNDTLQNQLEQIAFKCGFEKINLNSDKRAKAHISAVMVNNFVNHVLYKSFQWADLNKIDVALFKPLAQETIVKAFDLGGLKSQTGPAKRKNTDIINEHLTALNESADIKELYKNITKSIIKEFEG